MKQTILLLALPAAAQVPFSKAVTWPSKLLISTPVRISATAANDGRFWVTNYGGETKDMPEEGHLMQFNSDGIPVSDRVIRGQDGGLFYIVHFVEMPTGYKYMVLQTVNNQSSSWEKFYVVCFDANWNMNWIRQWEENPSYRIIAETIGLLVDKAGRVYCCFSATNFNVVCIASDGALLWARATPTDLRLLGGVVQPNIAATLDESRQELVCHFYDRKDSKNFLLKLNLNNGTVIRCRSSKDFYVRKILLLPDGNYAVASGIGIAGESLYISIFTPQFGLVRSWSVENGFNVGANMLNGPDNTIIANYATNIATTSFLRLDVQGNVLSNRRYDGLVTMGSRMFSSPDSRHFVALANIWI